MVRNRCTSRAQCPLHSSGASTQSLVIRSKSGTIRSVESTHARLERFAALTASLTLEEWATDTDCVGWDVRKVPLHTLGSAEAQASPLVFLHQLRRGIPLSKDIDSHHWVDGLTELQILERS